MSVLEAVVLIEVIVEVILEADRVVEQICVGIGAIEEQYDEARAKPWSSAASAAPAALHT